MLAILFFIKLFAYFKKARPYPKKLLIASLVGGLLTLGVFGYSTYFFSFKNLEGELFRGPLDSPSGEYTANAYFITYGGAASSKVDVWVDITFNNETKKVQTVYYSDAQSTFFMQWNDQNRLSIQNEEFGYPDNNRSIELEIGTEIYHETGDACTSLLMRNKYETCYQDE